MFTRRGMLIVTGALVALTYVGSAQAQDWKAKYPELVFSPIPVENAQSVTDRFGSFADYLQKRLGVKVTLRVANDYAAVIEGQRSGNIHIANYGAASFARALITGVKTEAFATDLNADGTKGYYSVFYVLASSPYKTVKDLKGKNLGLVDPNSTSGNNVPRFEFNKMGLKPDDFFGKVQFTGSHQNAVLALFEGTVDMAANEWASAEDNHVVKMSEKGMLKNKDGSPGKYGDVRIINKSDEILNGPYAVLSDLPEDLKAQIVKAFMDLPKDDPATFQKFSEGKKKGLVAVSSSDYQPTVELVKFVDSLRKQ